jgi:tetratricopeptide (TPR) repeat protein
VEVVVNTKTLEDLARAAEDVGNHAEAYAYWKQVIEADPSNPEGWFGKAVAAGWDSDLRRDRLAEMISGIEQAIARAPESERVALRRSSLERRGWRRDRLLQALGEPHQGVHHGRFRLA